MALPLDLRSLEIFLAVCDSGSMSGAARALAMTQPAVSLAIAELERKVGSALFDRDVRPLAVTVAGEVLRQRGSVLIAEAREIPALLRETKHGKVPSIRVGLVDSLSRTLSLPVATFLKLRAGEVSILSGLTATHASDLLTRRLDIFLGVDDLQDLQGLERWEIASEPYVLLMGASRQSAGFAQEACRAGWRTAVYPVQRQVSDGLTDRTASAQDRYRAAAHYRIR